MADIILDIDNLTVAYNRAPAVHHVSFQVERGDLIALIGPNGAGKSTLMKAILGWIPPATGTIRFSDDVASGKQAVAYLPQHGERDIDFPATVESIVAQGRVAARGMFAAFRDEDYRAVEEAIRDVGLAGYGCRQLRTLSGGQEQRVFLARALCQGAEVFLLDEPFDALDIHAAIHLGEMLAEWAQRGRTIIAVVHDLLTVRRYFKKTLILATHRIAFGLTAEVLNDDNIRNAYHLPENCHIINADGTFQAVVNGSKRNMADVADGNTGGEEGVT